MRLHLLLLVLAAAALPGARAFQPAAASPRARLGINLAGPADWNTELPFVDVFRMSREWISQRKGAAWGKGPALATDARGWVTRLEPDCYAETLLCTIEGGHYPAGEYTVLYEGEGTLDFNNAVVVSRSPGRIVIRPDPARGAFFLRLMAVNPQKYVRNLRVLTPGSERTAGQNPWTPGFLKRWQGMACLRFMDFMETNHSPVAHWADRPRPDDATWSRKGIPVELMVDLANRLKADPWFCMPHQADDDFVRQFARRAQQLLAPERKVYLEYSNEVWNGQFQQNRYAAAEGQRLGFAEKPREAAWRYTAYRSGQIFTIWEEAFSGRARLVRVLPSQAANLAVSEQVLGFRDAGHNADALAIAPYFGLMAGPASKPPAGEVRNWTVEQALDQMERVALPQSIQWVRASRQLADRYGLRLVAYEAGQHMVGIQGAENDDTLTRLFQAANAHPRMGELYRQYYDSWAREGGDLLCHFSSVTGWSKWGSWGLLQYADDDPARSPKFAATMRWGRSLGQPVNSP